MDNLSGIEIDLPYDMDYEDSSQNLSIHLKAGKQTLGGKEALGFLRYRSGYVTGDLGRIDAQKLFLNAFINRLGTITNPFRYEYRRLMIQKVFPEYFDRITILGITDRANPSDDESWGEYLLNTIYQSINIKPDAIYQGEENKHNKWFDSFNIPIINIDRGILKVSATEIRKAIVENNFEYFKAFMPEALYSEFKNLRKILKDVESN